MVGAGRPDQVWVLAGALRVPRPQDGGAEAIAPGQRVEVVLDGVDLAVVWVAEVWGIWVLLGGLLAGQVLLGQLEAGLETLLGGVAMRDGVRQGGERGRHEKLWEEHLGVDVLVLIACESMCGGVGLEEGEREGKRERVGVCTWLRSMGGWRMEQRKEEKSRRRWQNKYSKKSRKTVGLSGPGACAFLDRAWTFWSGV